MRTSEIWLQPADKRLPLFLERWHELAEHIGNRTYEERIEMAEIADAHACLDSGQHLGKVVITMTS